MRRSFRKEEILGSQSSVKCDLIQVVENKKPHNENSMLLSNLQKATSEILEDTQLNNLRYNNDVRFSSAVDILLANVFSCKRWHFVPKCHHD